MNSTQMNKAAKKTVSVRDLIGALGEHVEQLRPSVNAKPKNKQISVARASATLVNSTMGAARTSLQAYKMTGEKPELDFFRLEEQKAE